MLGCYGLKIFTTLHDPTRSRYAIYYSTVLVVVIITATLLVSGILEITYVEGTMIFIEGFVALFMLVRHEKVGNSFLHHIKKIKAFFIFSSTIAYLLGIVLFETITELGSKISIFSKS